MPLREDTIAIWTAGLRAVDSELLIQQNVECTSEQLKICDDRFDLRKLGRIEVVGAGKAGAGMARGLLSALQNLLTNTSVSGWVNVPDDCVEPLGRIHLHSARPAGINEPTADGVTGTQEILRRISSLREDDLCIVLISGGGSALLPAPEPEISLADKQIVTRVLARAGAPIESLNIVRSQLSGVKGGGLLRHCMAGKIVSLIVSDVIGDPLDIIASGPTCPSMHTPQDALRILEKYDTQRDHVPAGVYRFLQKKSKERLETSHGCPVSNYIIGSNRVAVAAAANEAERRGYNVISLGSENPGLAREYGPSLLRHLMRLRDSSERNRHCIIAGGETTVELAETALPRSGGRNQEIILAAVAGYSDPQNWQGLSLLSGGTDGEDGPTDAAGAIADQNLVERMQRSALNPTEFLAINNSYPFFEQLGGLLKTGPTHTNVMDLAVGVCENQSEVSSYTCELPNTNGV